MAAVRVHKDTGDLKESHRVEMVCGGKKGEL